MVRIAGVKLAEKENSYKWALGGPESPGKYSTVFKNLGPM
jgi:hypothetical protein